MVIIFWLFLLFSPILWIVSLILLLVKRRPLTFLLNSVLCGVIIYLMWTGLGSGPHVADAADSSLDDIGNMASSIVEGLTKGFIAMLVAAAWGMSILVYSLLCTKAEKPELELWSGRIHNRSFSTPVQATTAPAKDSSASKPASRSNLIAYFAVGAVVLYLLAKKAAEMGL